MNGDPVGHQERGVEAHAELADDVHVRGAGLHLLLEVQGAAVRDDPQVGVHVLLGHPDSVVRDRDRAGVLVVGDVNRVPSILEYAEKIGLRVSEPFTFNAGNESSAAYTMMKGKIEGGGVAINRPKSCVV